MEAIRVLTHRTLRVFGYRVGRHDRCGTGRYDDELRAAHPYTGGNHLWDALWKSLHGIFHSTIFG
jgi:hypothetical protein